MDDPFFRRSLILVLEHSDQGTYGVIVNRPTDLTVQEVLEGLKIDWRGDADEPTFFGGPVQPERGAILVNETDQEPLSETFVTIGEGVLMTQNSSDLELLAEDPPSAFRLVLGCAGWDADQLVEEFGRHDWIALPCQPDLIFSKDMFDTWKTALLRAGIQPHAIPPVTQPSSDPMAN